MNLVLYVLTAAVGLLTMLLLPGKVVFLLDGIDVAFLKLTKSDMINIVYFLVLLGVNTPIYILLSKLGINFKSEKRIIALSFILILISYVALTPLYIEPFVIDTVSTLLNRADRWVALSLIIFILAPITEEVVVRGVVLTSLDAGLSKIINCHRIISSVLVSLFFSLIHQQYQSLSTYILLILVSLCLCLARFHSQTIWVPISLHFFASCLAVGLPMLAI